MMILHVHLGNLLLSGRITSRARMMMIPTIMVIQVHRVIVVLLY